MNTLIKRMSTQKTFTINGMKFENVYYGDPNIVNGNFVLVMAEDIKLRFSHSNDKIYVQFIDYIYMDEPCEETINITENTSIKDLKSALDKVMVKAKEHLSKRLIGLIEQENEVVGCLEMLGFQQEEYDQMMDKIPKDYFAINYNHEYYKKNYCTYAGENA